MSADALAAVIAPLSPEQIANLARRQTPAVRARIEALTKPAGRASSKPKGLRTPKVDGLPLVTTRPGVVEVTLKGLELQLSPNRTDSHTNPHAVGRVRATERSLVSSALNLVPTEAVPRFPVKVVIVRCGPARMDDDNRTATAKGCRDAVAHWLGVDDRDPRVSFAVRGLEGGGQGYGVRVEITGGV